MPPDRDSLRFNALRNALYHTARRRGLERLNRGFSFLVVVLGASAAGDVLSGLGIDQSWMALAVAVIGAAQLVFDFGGQAREHQVLQSSYFNLVADIEEAGEPSAEDCAAWYGRIIRITADEPPVLRALDAKAYNDALDALELHDESERLHVPFLHRIFASVLAFEGHRYRKMCEIERHAIP